MSSDENSDENEGFSYEDDENDSDYEVKIEKFTLKMKRVKKKKTPQQRYIAAMGFRNEFMELFPWAEEDPEDKKGAICRACNRKMRATKNVLEAHQKTKFHIKNISGSDEIEDEDSDKDVKNILNGKLDQKPSFSQHPAEQVFPDDQFSFFSESPIDSAHQAITSIIDKLVEKYHENKLENLKIQNKALNELRVHRANFAKYKDQKKLERKMQKDAYDLEVQATEVRLMQELHEAKIRTMEAERDAKLKAVEQQLQLARQEYLKKVKVLDQQLQFIK